MWDDIIDVLGGVAPTIATALGGPLAGGAVKLLTEALDVGPDADTTKVKEALVNTTPEQIAALKKAEQQFAIRMRELGIELEKVHSSDRDSARKREAAVKDWMPGVLATVFVVGFFGAAGVILSGQLNLTGEQGLMIGTVFGAIAQQTGQIISYYFGSSNTEKQTNLFAKLGKN